MLQILEQFSLGIEKKQSMKWTFASMKEQWIKSSGWICLVLDSIELDPNQSLDTIFVRIGIIWFSQPWRVINDFKLRAKLTPLIRVIWQQSLKRKLIFHRFQQNFIINHFNKIDFGITCLCLRCKVVYVFFLNSFQM